jgi:hypothetical protein
MVMAKSVRYSCTNDQKPLSVSIATFVVTKATIIMISKGIAPSLVSNPIKIKMAQTISNEPVKYAQKVGLLKPIFVNLPTPAASEVMNFRKPSARKINPTTNRGMSAGTFEVIINLFFIDLLEYLVTKWWVVRNFDLIKFKIRSLMAIVACTG